MVDRSARISLLAKAPDAALIAAWRATGLAPDFTWVRRPESGAVMVRGRAGATGAPFNLGEMTVTRAALRLATGITGFGYVAGRSARKVEIAALCDALAQDPAHTDRIEDEILAPMRDALARAAEGDAARAAATKVDFFTMARGEP